MTLRLRYSVRSHVGKVRDGNEDSAYAGARLALVADGMGGHAAGEVASSAVVATLAQLDDDEAGADLLEVLAQAVEAANDHLRAMVDADSALDGMGTTLTVLLSSGSRLGLAHVGDSRAYLLRDGEFSQLTHDQTLVQRMVDEGRITLEQAETHPQRSLLTQALDGRAGVQPDLSVREARLGDRYLLCSDGLSGYVPVDAMAAAVAIPDADEAAETLVEHALRAGAPDNVTVVIADVVEDEAGLVDTPLVGGAAAEQLTVPTASPALVMPGGASLSPEERASRRAARQHSRTFPPPSSPPPGGAAAGPGDRPVDTGVFRRPGASSDAPADASGPALGPPPDFSDFTSSPATSPTLTDATPPAGLPPVVEPLPYASSGAERPRRRWFRRPVPLTVIGLVVLVAAGVGITLAVAANSWYVARDGANVALYHGIRTAPLGISLSSVEQQGTPLDDLRSSDQQLVRAGIIVDTRQEGVCTLARLRFHFESDRYEALRRTMPTASATPSASASATRSPTTTPRSSAAPSRGAGAVAGPSPSVSVRPSASPTPSPTPTLVVPSPSPLPASCPP